MIKQTIIALLILFPLISNAQRVTVMDFVQVLPGKEKEAFFYYEQNWKLYRDAALSKGIITGYRIEKTSSDTAAAFNLVLITEYRDKHSYEKSEENFRDILSSLRPDGPVLLNQLQPQEFRKSLFVKVSELMAAARTYTVESQQ